MASAAPITGSPVGAPPVRTSLDQFETTAANDELTLVQIDGEPSEACVADWKEAARLYRENSAKIAAADADYDWSEFRL